MSSMKAVQEKISHRQLSLHCEAAHSLCCTLSRQGLTRLS